jgi:hypothetical protein
MSTRFQAPYAQIGRIARAEGSAASICGCAALHARAAERSFQALNRSVRMTAREDRLNARTRIP